MKLLFSAVCASLGGLFLYLSFVSAPAELWTPTELAVGAIAYGPMFGAALFSVVSALKGTSLALPWVKLFAMAACSGVTVVVGYNAAGALFGFAATAIAWLVFLGMMKDNDATARLEQ